MIKREKKTTTKVKDKKEMASIANTEMMKIIGERIKIIRTEIGKNQAEIETALNLPKLTLHRIEFGVGGTIPAFLFILQYLSDEGYNTKWILERNNNNELKKKDQAFTIDLERDKIKDSISKLTTELDNLEKYINKI